MTAPIPIHAGWWAAEIPLSQGRHWCAVTAEGEPRILSGADESARWAVPVHAGESILRAWGLEMREEAQALSAEADALCENRKSARAHNRWLDWVTRSIAEDAEARLRKTAASAGRVVRRLRAERDQLRRWRAEAEESARRWRKEAEYLRAQLQQAAERVKAAEVTR